MSGGSLQNAIANGDTRVIKLHHMHTGEDITITYRQNGRYDQAALQKLNWFLRDWRRDEPTRMDPHLFDIIWEVKTEVGNDETVHVVSAYRSPTTNAMLRSRSRGVAKHSQHMLGKAMDFYIPGVPISELRVAGLRLQEGGVGFYPTAGSPFVHMDTGSVRHWPRMSRDQLVRVFPDGKTVHVPTDGKPLSGYALALSEIQSRGGTASSQSIEMARANGINVDDPTRPIMDRKGGAKGNLLARIFGLKDDEDDEEVAPVRSRGRKPPVQQIVTATGPNRAPVDDEEAPAPRQVAQAAKPSEAPAEKPVEKIAEKEKPESRGPVFANVPLPTPRPAEPAAAQPRYANVPLPMARPENIPAQMAAALAFAPASPQPRPEMPPQTVTSSRPDQQMTVAMRGAEKGEETTASVSALPREITRGTAHDAQFASALMAYASPAGGFASEPPMLRKSASAGTRRTAAAPRSSNRNGALRADDPWLRALVLTPSIENAMTVAALGEPDHKTVDQLIAKPDNCVALAFIKSDTVGPAAGRFAGGAIGFVSTVPFARVRGSFSDASGQ